MHSRPTIATITWTTTRLGLEISKGVSDYGREHDWAVLRFDNQAVMDTDFFVQSGVVGFVVQAFAQFSMDRLLALKRPTVNVSNSQLEIGLPKVAPDDVGVGELAAEYFLGKGFTHFAFCGDSVSGASELRGQGFVRALQTRGFAAPVIRGRFDLPVAYLPNANIADLIAWLSQLPRPCAVFAWNDNVCDTILNICRHEGWAVPEQISILGVNNDFNRLVDSEDDSISSIQLSGHAIGFQAARLLAGLLRGAPPPRAPKYIAPLRIVERRSTDFYAVADPAVQTALRFIKRSYQRPTDVEEIARAAMLSRRVLEKRFRVLLRSSPYEEVLKWRLDRARELLLNTDLKIEEIGQLCGYDDGSNFSIFFREKTGSTPKAFRGRLRPAR